MHRVKGLEFDRLVLAGLDHDLMPYRDVIDRSEDESVKQESLDQERSLLYVALTRARKAVLITAQGKPTSWLGVEA